MQSSREVHVRVRDTVGVGEDETVQRARKDEAAGHQLVCEVKQRHCHREHAHSCRSLRRDLRPQPWLVSIVRQKAEIITLAAVVRPIEPREQRASVAKHSRE
eukprot:1440381-Prymnesium_polylepis.2